jgi:hypothetical protein
MAESWLEQGEELVGSWSVFVGDPTPNSAKITGKIFVTNRYVRFQAGLSLDKNAATSIAAAYLLRHRLPPFEKITDHVAIPFSDIGDALMVKKSLFQKSLNIKLKSGEELEFQFGAMSPQKALDGIKAHLAG